MNRDELERKFRGRVLEFRATGFEDAFYLKSLSGLGRVKASELYAAIKAVDEGAPAERLRVTLEAQCFVISQGLVDEAGERLYPAGEDAAIGDLLPCGLIDQLSEEIMRISTTKPGDLEKNLQTRTAFSPTA
jgi:hypothetical protein